MVMEGFISLGLIILTMFAVVYLILTIGEFVTNHNNMKRASRDWFRMNSMIKSGMSRDFGQEFVYSKEVVKARRERNLAPLWPVRLLIEIAAERRANRAPVGDAIAFYKNYNKKGK